VLAAVQSFADSRLVSGLEAIGIIDGDYWPKRFLASTHSSVHVLDVHEVESLLCLPEVVRAVARHLGKSEDAADTLYEEFVVRLRAALWVGGVIANRQKPLRVWGPSGSEDRLGTAYAIEHMKEMYAWDAASRLGNIALQGLTIDVTEFDYRAVNAIVYQENGVTIRSIPAIHALDGPVSFILEWNDLKFAFSSDTYPNTWWIEYTQDADLAVHECFAPPSIMIEKQKFPVLDALNVTTQVHTSPAQFGKVMSAIRPRMAVGYHVFNDFDTEPLITELVRSTYDGPFVLATDYMVFNVTQEEIRVRMAVVDEDIWPLPSVIEKLSANPADRVGFSPFIISGRQVYQDVIDEIYADVNETYGTSFAPPTGRPGGN
jgi:ribonuclease Z